jgi:plastocyanin
MPKHPRRPLLTALLTLAVISSLAACGGQGSGDSPGGGAAAGGAPATSEAAGGAGPAGQEVPNGNVPIEDFKFVPEVARVRVGDTVTWTNEDAFPHSVVADDKSFRSENFGKGGSFSHRFDTAGKFSYICGVHNYMTGTIVVS